MPVYADDQEFNYEDQLTQIQQLNGIGELNVDYHINDTPVEINDPGNGLVRSPSINPDVPFEFYGFTATEINDTQYMLSANFTGTIPSPYTGFIIDNNIRLSPPNYQRERNKTFTLTYIRLYDATNNVEGPTLWSGSYTYDGDITVGGNTVTISYLSSVQQVFTWILNHIAELITFILGNAFLAVGLVLFMCGAVISFFVRIKRT